MKKEVKLLRQKGVCSLILAIEFFNRPFDGGRIDSVLIFLDHAFEMLLKAAILHKGGKIREPRKTETIGLDKCIRKGLTENNVKFLNKDQALTIQQINGLRDAAQHHLLELSEEILYAHTQAGVTLFRDLCLSAFGADIAKEVPARVLPISVVAPTEIVALFDREVAEIRKLLEPKKRQKMAAHARLRGLVILDSAIRGNPHQPSASELKKVADKIAEGIETEKLFTGVSSIALNVTGDGPSIALRITKKEGIPIHIVKEGDGGSVVAIKRVNELDYYSLGLNQLAKKASLTPPRALAVIRHLKLQDNDDYFKELKVGKQSHKRYSAKALDALKKKLPDLDLDAVWEKHRPGA